MDQNQTRGAHNVASVYEIVTNQILDQLQSGVVPWRKPWASAPPRNLCSQREYTGINTFLLASEGYASPYWLTFNQVGKLGGNVKQGAKPSLVTFWKIGGYRKQNAETGEVSEKESKSILLRYYRVFNLDQTDSIAEKLGLANVGRIPALNECERIVSTMPNPPKREQDGRAWYRPSTDTVGMPARDAFLSSEAYYSTLFHELTHSTGHASRIGREGIEKLERFGSESYSREELVAELGSAMLCGVCGIAPATIENSASYLQSWINVLKSDSRVVITAASAAQKAADYMRGIRHQIAEN
jgi:antirestriction protein ArdC